MSKKKKKALLNSLSTIKYTIYGIFDFKTNHLVYVNLDYDMVELEFDLTDYDMEHFDIVSFDVLLF
jgi:hypothetical protein